MTQGRDPQASASARRKAEAAGSRLLEIYALLAGRGQHVLAGVLGGQAPRQWQHYPQDDAIDPDSGFQWFYHAHSPQDRPGTAEHGHVHLFARSKLWARRLRSADELAFARLGGGASAPVGTRHLLAIGLDAKGVPISLFTVNSWVTGDLMLSASTTADLLERMSLDTGHAEIDAVIECVVALYRSEIGDLLAARDRRLFGWRKKDVLRDEGLEVLSEQRIDIDRRI